MAGIFIALLTLFIVLTYSWMGFGFRHFMVVAPLCFIGLIFLITAIGAVGGYVSYLCFKNDLNPSVPLSVISCLLFILFLCMIAFAYLRGGTCSQTVDIADWGSYDCGVAEMLDQTPFSLFPASGSNGTPTAYFYEYDWFLGSPVLKIRASEAVSSVDFQTILRATRSTPNAKEEINDGNQPAYRIAIFHNRYISVRLDCTTLKIHYEIKYW